MTRKTDQVLAVVFLIRQRKPNTLDDIHKLRVEATRDCARDYGVDRSTIQDKYSDPKQLGFAGTEHFERLVASYLFKGSRELERHLARHVISEYDREAVARFFKGN